MLLQSFKPQRSTYCNLFQEQNKSLSIQPNPLALSCPEFGLQPVNISSSSSPPESLVVIPADKAVIGIPVCIISIHLSAASPYIFVPHLNSTCHISWTSRSRHATYATCSSAMNRTGGLSSGLKLRSSMKRAYSEPRVPEGSWRQRSMRAFVSRGLSCRILWWLGLREQAIS